MNFREAIERTNSDWVYDPDGKLDTWSFDTPGDCENYALRVLMFILGSKGAARRALLRGDAHIWFVRTPRGAGHAVLEYRGRFVDNRKREMVNDISELNLAPGGRRYTRLELVAKLGVGRILGIFD